MDLLTGLNEPQRQAVMHGDGPLLVLAGAGSGKTRVITRRVAYLVSQGVAPRQILAITFTNKAAGEMKERIAALGTPPGATIGTFHAVCAVLLRQFAADVGLSPHYSIFDRDDQLRLVKQAIKLLDRPGDLTPAVVHSAISRAKNELQTPQAMAETAKTFFQARAAEVYAEYQKLLAGNEALDFDDLLLRVAILLRDRADVREYLGQRYRYVLIDEYQDTNHAQYLIAHGVAKDHSNICATGDPDQSIYAWRGADIGNILEFERDYPNAVVVRLEENYRSTSPILAAASSLIDHNMLRKRKTLWTRREGGQDVHVAYTADEHAEAALVATRLAEWRSAGGVLDDAAIFYRLNSQSRVFEEALFQSQIPYRVARGVEFFHRKEVKDVLAYLRLIYNPSDDISCQRIINTPARGIGQSTVDKLAIYARRAGKSLLAACATPELAGLGKGPSGKVKVFGELMAVLAKDIDRPVRDIAEDVYRRSGYEAGLAGEDEELRQARGNVEELITSCAEFDQRQGAGLEEYLRQVALVSDTDHFDGAQGAVTLMTLHAAKGLEFPCVFVVGCEEGLLPFVRESFGNGDGFEMNANKEADEEERRLMFVGMTRSKDLLTLTCARRRTLRGVTQPRAASRFLDEIGRAGVTVENFARDESRPAAAEGQFRGGFWERQGQGTSQSSDDDKAVENAMADEQPLPSEYEYLRVGSRVRHLAFGEGTITKLSQPWPETRAEVFFDRLGPKKLVLRVARLEMVE